MSDLSFHEISAKCQGCGRGLASGKWCIPCYRARCRPCSKCRDNSGKLRSEYQRHAGPLKSRCKRCGVQHEDVRQKACPICQNERVVFAEASTA